VNSKSIVDAIGDTLELKALPKDKIKAFFTEGDKAEYVKSNVKTVLMVAIPSFVVITIGLFLLVKYCKCCVPLHKILGKIEKLIFFKLIIRLTMAVYINVCITAFVVAFVKQDLNTTSGSMIGFLVAVCVFSLVFALVSKQEFLDKESVKARIGTLYQNLDRRRWSRVAQTSVFFTRRFLYVLILT